MQMQIGVFIPTKRVLIRGYMYEMGVWFHLGWSHDGDWSTAYKDGCPLISETWTSTTGSYGPYPGIHYGKDMTPGTPNIADVLFDESYIWEEEKPEAVFTLLYYGSGLH